MDDGSLPARLAERRILLAAENHSLLCRGDAGGLDDELKAALDRNQEALLAALQTRPGWVQLCPLSYNQLSLFLLHLLEPTSAAYNLALTLRVRAPLEAPHLREALDRLAQQHEPLRTTFGLLRLGGASVACQFVAEQLSPVVEEIDARSWSEQELWRQARAFYAAPIDLENGPVLVAGLFTSGPAEHALVVRVHHAAADGRSLSVMARDLGRHCRDVRAGTPASSPAAGTYARYCLEQRRFLAEPEGQRQLRYWQNVHTPAAPGLRLGPEVEARRPAVRRSVGATQYFHLDAAGRERLRDCAQRLGVRFSALLLGAFESVLLRRSAQDDVVIGIPTLGRRPGEHDDAIGYFVNPIALRSRRPVPLPFVEHVRQAGREFEAALANADAPLASVVERIQVARDPSRTPVFQALFNLIARRTVGDVIDLIFPSLEEIELEFGGLPGTAFALDQGEGQFDLALTFVDRGRSLLGQFQYCTDLFTADEAAAFVREVRDLLDRAASGAAIDTVGGARLPALDAAQRARVVELGARTTPHAAFWAERLRGLRPPVLPYSAAAPAAASTPASPAAAAASGFDAVDVPISSAAAALLAGLPSDERRDFAGVVFALYLYRLCGGEPFDLELRTRELSAMVAGLEAVFSDRVPLRVEVEDGLSARAACEAISRRLRETTERLTYSRDLTGDDRMAPLPVGVAWLGPGTSEPRDGAPDVCLAVHEGSSPQLCYRPAALDAAQARAMADQLGTFLDGIASDPERPFARIPLLPAAEARRVLVEWNDTAVEYPGDMVLHHFIEQQARATPDAEAVRFAGRSISYRELDRRANNLAAQLRAAGISSGGLVGLYMERSLEMVVGLLAILKAGAAYVPMDPAYPVERIAFMLEDTRVPVILTQAPLASRIPAGDARRLCLDAAAGEDGPGAPVDCRVSPDQPAYVIFTSGSTGKPKGAVNTHRAISNRLLWMQQEYGLTAQDRVLQKTPYSFDVSVWEFFWPLMTGACLVVARPGGHQDGAYLVDAIQTEGITTLHFVPSMLQLFVEQPGLDRCTSLRRVFCSGEALPYELQQRFFERSRAELHNLYGPTEAAVDVTYWACRRDDTRHVVPIGRPVANTQTYVLDRFGNPTPIGVPGELHLGGVQLASGYLNRPELTKERFIPDPFSARPGARLYRTGDLCRHLPDGAIEYLGRLDFQVKIRGFRIELGEIETALAGHPAIRQAVVVAQPDEKEPTRTFLVAYVVADAAAPAAAELRAHLARTLPEFMVPAAFVVLDSFPLNANGKLDRKALPRARLAPCSGSAPALPTTDVQRKVAAIFREVLRLEEVGIDDNFFEIGGDSLRAARIVDMLRAELSPDLAIVRLFEHPTIRALADHLAGVEKADALAGARDRAARQREALRRRPARRP